MWFVMFVYIKSTRGEYGLNEMHQRVDGDHFFIVYNLFSFRARIAQLVRASC